MDEDMDQNETLKLSDVDFGSKEWEKVDGKVFQDMYGENGYDVSKVLQLKYNVRIESLQRHIKMVM